MMRGTLCINQCAVDGWLFGAILLKRDNSGRYKIINNERELRGVKCKKLQSAF